MFKWIRTQLQRGQAIVEYMPTLAGAMAVTTVTLIYIGGGVTDSYCKVVDALGEPPDVCTEDAGGDESTPSDGGEEGDAPASSADDPAEETCIMSLAGVEDGSWDPSWSEGDTDTLVVSVSELDEPISYSLSLTFPNDPDAGVTEIASGEFVDTGEESFEITYPAKGDWGPISPDGDGKYNAHVELTVEEPCEGIDWTRYYEAPPEADLGIVIDHEESPVTAYGETLIYNMTVTNYGPYNAGTGGGQGTVVSLPAPPDVDVLAAFPSQGVCDTQIACDLGVLGYNETATIQVVTSVTDPDACALDGLSTVSAAYPTDPNLGNNEDSTFPSCNLACVHQVTSFSLMDTTDPNNPVDIATLDDGSILRVDEDDRFNVRANVAGNVDYVQFRVNDKVMNWMDDHDPPYMLTSTKYTYWDLEATYYTIEAWAYDDHGDTCSTYTIHIEAQNADPNNPLQPPCTCIPAGEPPDVPDDPNDDPFQPTGEAGAPCPDSHPVRLVEFNHYATPSNLARELRWGYADQQSHTYTFDMPAAQEAMLVTRSAVGHPELDCPNAWQEPLCVQPNQDNEHWKVSIDGNEIATLRDNGAWDHVFLKFADLPLGELAEGPHTLTMEHAGLLDMPTNSYTPSVGALAVICLQETQ